MASNGIYLSTDFSAAGGILEVGSTRKPITDTNLLSNTRRPPFPPEKSGFALEATGHFRTQELNRFRVENRDLLYVIDQSDKAREFLSKTDIQTRDDLVKVIAEAANDALTGEAKQILDEKTLKKNPFVASLLALNVGGLLDRVNEDTGTAKILAASSQTPEKDIYTKVGKQAASLFKEGSPLNDENFFKNHPKAAVYLLKNRDAVSSLNESADRGTSSANPQRFLEQNRFKDKVSSSAYDDMLNTFISNFAQEAVNSGPYSDTFFSDHIDLAEYVAAGEFVSDIPQPSEFLRDHPEYTLDNPATNDLFNFTNIAQDILSDQASNLMGPGSALTESVFRSNLGLARLIVQDDRFREALKNNETRQVINSLVGQGLKDPPSQNVLKSLQERFQATFEGPNEILSLIA